MARRHCHCLGIMAINTGRLLRCILTLCCLSRLDLICVTGHYACRPASSFGSVFRHVRLLNRSLAVCYQGRLSCAVVGRMCEASSAVPINAVEETKEDSKWDRKKSKKEKKRKRSRKGKGPSGLRASFLYEDGNKCLSPLGNAACACPRFFLLLAPSRSFRSMRENQNTQQTAHR